MSARFSHETMGVSLVNRMTLRFDEQPLLLMLLLAASMALMNCDGGGGDSEVAETWLSELMTSCCVLVNSTELRGDVDDVLYVIVVVVVVVGSLDVALLVLIFGLDGSSAILRLSMSIAYIYFI